MFVEILSFSSITESVFSVLPDLLDYQVSKYILKKPRSIIKKRRTPDLVPTLNLHVDSSKTFNK